jgi:hypothetical protein
METEALGSQLLFRVLPKASSGPLGLGPDRVEGGV